MWHKYLCTFLTSLTTMMAPAQEGRFKLGLGTHYISNNYEADYLYDFGALSLNTAYALWQLSRLTVSWEQQVVLRNREDAPSRRTAFIAAAPLVFRYHLRRKDLYAGAGPAYLHQQYRSYAIDQKVNGLQLQALAGVSIRNKTAMGFLLPEWHFRAGVFKSLNSNNAAPHLSVLLLLGAKKSPAKT